MEGWGGEGGVGVKGRGYRSRSWWGGRGGVTGVDPGGEGKERGYRSRSWWGGKGAGLQE